MKPIVITLLAFTMTAGIAFSQKAGPSAISSQQRWYSKGKDVSPPRAIVMPEPEYSEEACKAKHEGAVALQVGVNEKGAPVEIRVVKKLGLGLDEKAIEAVQKSRFTPGVKDGLPVPVLTVVEVVFRLPASCEPRQ